VIKSPEQNDLIMQLFTLHSVKKAYMIKLINVIW
jgi:hypothetical protein